MNNKKIIKRSEVDPNNKTGWIADLSPNDIVNPDFYWYFDTKREAKEFLELVDNGLSPEEAEFITKAL